LTISTDGSGHPLTILLVEDDDGDARAVERAFVRAKIANPIKRVVDGVAALETLKGENGRTPLPFPFVMLVDLNMPRMNGIQLVETLRQDEKLRRSIVFMLTTSKRDEDKIARWREDTWPVIKAPRRTWAPGSAGKTSRARA